MKVQQKCILSFLISYIMLLGSCQAPITQDSIYADPDNWINAPKGDNILFDVDVFYLYPTCYSAKPGSGQIISIIGDTNMRKAAKFQFLAQASVFDDACNVYAPVYPQIDASAGLSMPLEEKNKVMDTSVVRPAIEAFTYYLENYNQGRPFFLAGHSQGSNVLLLLMQKLFSSPELQNKLIAAYLIGYSVTAEDTLNFPYLKFAETKDDLGVIVSWNTEADSISGRNPVVEEGALSINPLNWSRKTDPAPDTMNLGAVFYNRQNGQPRLVPEFTGAYIHPARGTLIAPDPDPDLYIIGDGKLFPRGCYHSMDYAFFYSNLKENIAVRKEVYLRKRIP